MFFLTNHIFLGRGEPHIQQLLPPYCCLLPTILHILLLYYRDLDLWNKQFCRRVRKETTQIKDTLWYYIFHTMTLQSKMKILELSHFYKKKLMKNCRNIRISLYFVLLLSKTTFSRLDVLNGLIMRGFVNILKCRRPLSRKIVLRRMIRTLLIFNTLLMYVFGWACRKRQ